MIESTFELNKKAFGINSFSIKVFYSYVIERAVLRESSRLKHRYEKHQI